MIRNRAYAWAAAPFVAVALAFLMLAAGAALPLVAYAAEEKTDETVGEIEVTVVQAASQEPGAGNRTEVHEIGKMAGGERVPSSLPKTGDNLIDSTVSALALCVAGSVLVFASIRRRKGKEEVIGDA